jgi:5'-3' exonuclease
MGIRGLTGWIRWALQTSPTSIDWKKYSGKRIGIDILGFLYRAKAQQQPIVLYLAQLIAAFRAHNIEPVPIFDGKPPDEKREALKQRTMLRITSDAKRKQLNTDIEHVPMSEQQRSIVESALRTLDMNAAYLTSEERDVAKQFFYACGITPLNATGEADNVLAYFSKRGLVDAVISNDLDLLARGVETLLVPVTRALPGDTNGWTEYNLTHILNTASLSYEQFVEMCVLMGCDYTIGHKSFPYRSAYWSILYGKGFEYTLKKHAVPNAEVYMKAVDVLRGTYETQETLMGAKQWEKLKQEPQTETATLETLRTSILSSLTESEYAYLLGAYNFQHSCRGTESWVRLHNHPECTNC